MQLKEFDIILDIKKSYKTERFEVVQGDSYSNVLNITLVDGLHSYDLTGTTVEIVFSKSDGTTVQQTDITIINESRGRIQCILKTNTIASPGKVIAEVRVLDGDVLLTSTRFEFYVRRSLINDETIESTNEFPLLTQLIAETNDLIERVGDIEAQVPEEVVNNLNALADYVNDLAGEGRTTETVKGVSDALKTHEAENVTQAHGFIYEEGEWTPQFNASFNGVYGTQHGRYIRKGNEITVFFEIVATTFSLADDGHVSITQLPFNTDQNFPTTATINCYGKNTEDEISFEVANRYNVLYGFLYSNTNKVVLRKGSLNGSFHLKGSVVYRIGA